MHDQIFHWTSLISITLSVLVLILLFVRQKRAPQTSVSKLVFLLVVGFLPLFSLLLADTTLSHKLKKDQFCASCHIMIPFVKSLDDSNVQTLAPVHAQHRWIRGNRCYTCHTDYDLLGGVKSKIRGLRHLYAYYTNPVKKSPRLYRPISNLQCLQCHKGAITYEVNETHKVQEAEILANQISCMECHGPAHPESAVSE